MKNSLKKRGQKFIRKFSREAVIANEKSKEHIKENLIERVSRVENIRLLIFEWVLLIFALIMLAVTQAFWFGDSYAETTFVEGGTYTEATLGDVSSMNPLFATTSSEKVLSKLMFATISTVDYSGHVGIGLAKSIRTDKDGKIWKVKLRDNLRWSDGEPITNEDVLFSVNLMKNPTVNSIYSVNFANVKVSENADGEIIFELASSYADFISALNVPVVPKHILGSADPKTLIENDFSTSPVTSGAFKFNAVQTNSISADKTFYLSQNPYYYGGKTLLSAFAVHAYPDDDAIINAINNYSVTATAELSGKDINRVNFGGFERKESSINSGVFMFFNTTSPNVKNIELRRAIREGLNLDEIRSQAPDTAALDFPLIDAQISIKNLPKLPGYNFEKAKKKITELKKGNEIAINLATINSGYLPEITESIKVNLENLGLTVNLTTYDENQEFITNILSKRAYDILVYKVELGADPDPLPYYHSSQASATGLNLSNYRNVLVDDLLLGARDTINRELRARKYESFLEEWVNGVPAIGLYQPNLVYIYNKNVRAYSNNVRLTSPIDRFGDITSWSVTRATKNKTP